MAAHPEQPERRRFLARAGVTVGASALAACGALPATAADGAASGATADGLGAGSASDVACEADSAGPGLGAIPANPPFALDVAGAKLPFRQDDPAWGKDLMWHRDLVVQAATKLNGASKAEAESLLREFEDGNNIANEGCMLSCLAMVLRLFEPAAAPAWTPASLNDIAQAYYFYTPCGLSMTTLYADLVSDVSEGRVQCCLKEEYLPGMPGWKRHTAASAPLVRAYRSLAPQARSQFLLMLKTGTYDDTVASHYVLLDPADDAGPDDANPRILDPVQPPDHTGPWRLTDSAAAIVVDPDIAAAWVADAIEPTQLGGVWVFSRWQPATGRSYLAPLVAAWAAELAKG